MVVECPFDDNFPAGIDYPDRRHSEINPVGRTSAPQYGLNGACVTTEPNDLTRYGVEFFVGRLTPGSKATQNYIGHDQFSFYGRCDMP